MNNLAELLGAIAGDGHIDYGKRYASATHYKLVFSGNFTEDLEYYKKIKKFVNKLSQRRFCFYKQRRNELIARIYSKELVTYLVNKGAIHGSKARKIDFSNWLGKEEKLHFIRGLFDTDGSLTFKKKDNNIAHKYPIITLTLKSKTMISEISSILRKNNFYLCTCYYEKAYDRRN